MPATRTDRDKTRARIDLEGRRSTLNEYAPMVLQHQTVVISLIGNMVNSSAVIDNLTEIYGVKIPALVEAASLAHGVLDGLRQLEVALSASRTQLRGARREIEQAIVELNREDDQE